MREIYDKWIAVDYFFETIYCEADNENRLHQKIIELFETSGEEINAAVRIYRIQMTLLQEVEQKMAETGLPLNYFVRPKGLEHEPSTFDF